MIISKLTSPIFGKLALVATFLTLALASCSKDDVSSEIDPVVSPPADSEAPSYYDITETEGIGFTKDGIAYEYGQVLNRSAKN